MTTLNGPSGDNGFDQTITKSSIYGICAHFSSEDQMQNRIFYRTPLSRYNMAVKEEFSSFVGITVTGMAGV